MEGVGEMKVNNGRFTARPEGDVTVFLIGMRVNALHRPDRWLPVLGAMGPMLKHLMTHPEAGLLDFHSWFGRTTVIVSYWKSPEHLQRFASDPDAPHLEPWRKFVRRIGDDGTVGAWHETYVSSPGKREVVYVNMPPFGLGRATGFEPVGRGSSTAKQRLRH